MNYSNIHVRQLEGVLGFTRQGYYQYWKRQRGQQMDELQIVSLIKELREDHPRIGGRKLYSLLKEELMKREIKMGRDAFFDLLESNHLLIRRRRRKVLTTFSRHQFRKYPNLITELEINKPNQVWVADITYWLTQCGWLYISLITDAYSKRIMGYAVAETLEAVHCKSALQMALSDIDAQVGKSLIHHSDRGLQYCSGQYVSLLNSYNVMISMTQKSDPRENAIAERVNGIIKNEYLIHQPVYSLGQAQAVLEQAVFLYNYQRPHLSCDMLVPEQAHQLQGKLKRRWKNYYHKKIIQNVMDNEIQD
jgi:putative transposase